MIEVAIPLGSGPEREYAVGELLGGILGLPFRINAEERKDYALGWGGIARLSFADAFFGRFPDGAGYLKPGNVPARVAAAIPAPGSGSALPVLFGSGEIRESGGIIHCGIDLFAGVFFMLTRWEEHVLPDRDAHGRFPATASLAYRAGFLSRPLVDEYAGLLAGLLARTGCPFVPKRQGFRVIPSHDVDFLLRYPRLDLALRSFASALLKRRDPAGAFRFLKEYGSIRKGTTRDPFDTFDWLMDVSEAAGTKSRFYWMSGGRTQHDNNFRIGSAAARKTLARIRERGHIIGFHPSYDAYRDDGLFLQEKKALEMAAGMSVSEGRQHYLRFEVPYTWRVWERAGMALDSTLGYGDHEGFRCGTPCEYTPFDVLERRPMKLRELPLIAMDVTLKGYRRLAPERAFEVMRGIAEECRAVDSPMALLMHNSSLSGTEWAGWPEGYRDFVTSTIVN